MNTAPPTRSLRPSAEGWTSLVSLPPSASQIRPSPLTKLVSGAGYQARYLDECFLRLVLGELDVAMDLGWQVPPVATIPVALAGMRDADWTLDEDERAL